MASDKGHSAFFWLQVSGKMQKNITSPIIRPTRWLVILKFRPPLCHSGAICVLLQVLQGSPAKEKQESLPLRGKIKMMKLSRASEIAHAYALSGVFSTSGMVTNSTRIGSPGKWAGFLESSGPFNEETRVEAFGQKEVILGHPFIPHLSFTFFTASHKWASQLPSCGFKRSLRDHCFFIWSH